jgi:hypothetical protein
LQSSWIDENAPPLFLDLFETSYLIYNMFVMILLSLFWELMKQRQETQRRASTRRSVSFQQSIPLNEMSVVDQFVDLSVDIAEQRKELKRNQQERCGGESKLLELRRLRGQDIS